MQKSLNQITAEVRRIEVLTNDLKENLKDLKHIHSAYGAILIELELLSMNIAELRKNLENN
jgi:hypothetical protein